MLDTMLQERFLLTLPPGALTEISTPNGDVFSKIAQVNYVTLLYIFTEKLESLHVTIGL